MLRGVLGVQSFVGVPVPFSVVGDVGWSVDGAGGWAVGCGFEIDGVRPVIFVLTDISKTYYGYGRPVVGVGQQVIGGIGGLAGYIGVVDLTGGRRRVTNNAGTTHPKTQRRSRRVGSIPTYLGAGCGNVGNLDMTNFVSDEIVTFSTAGTTPTAASSAVSTAGAIIAVGVVKTTTAGTTVGIHLAFVVWAGKITAIISANGIAYAGTLTWG